MQYQRLLVQNIVFDRILSRLFSRVFFIDFSLSRRTPTSPIILGGIHQSHRSEDHLVEATRKLQQGGFIRYTPTHRDYHLRYYLQHTLIDSK